jgi:acetophenone carboxylase
MKRQITENLDIDLISEMWCCHHCGHALISARENYKRGCLIYERDPTTIYRPGVEGKYSLAPNPNWTAIVEFYCPQCATMIENEMLPIGHPLTYDLELDIDTLKRKYISGD